MTRARGPPPPCAAAAARGAAARCGPHSAWDELASVKMTLPARDDAGRASAAWWRWPRCGRRAPAISTTAFDTLASAFQLDPDDAEARAALERLAEANDAWDRLVAVLDDAIEETGEAERVVRLLIDSAGVREKQKQASTTPRSGYHRALGMQPAVRRGAVAAGDALSPVASGWNELADAARAAAARASWSGCRRAISARLRALELADVYERLGNTYEAIDAWQRVAAARTPITRRRSPSLARLYEIGRPVVQGDRVADARARRRSRRRKSGQERARAQLRKRVGEIFEQGAGAARARRRGVRGAARRRSRRCRRSRRRSRGCTRSWGAGAISRRCSRRRSERWGDAASKARRCSSGARRCSTEQAAATTTGAAGGACGSCASCVPTTTSVAARLRARARPRRAARGAGRALLRERIRAAKRATAPSARALLVELAQLEARARRLRRRRRSRWRRRSSRDAGRSARAGRAGAAARGRQRLGRLRGGARARGRGGGDARQRRCARSSTRRACTSSGARTTPAAQRGARARAGKGSRRCPRRWRLLRVCSARGLDETIAPTSWRAASWSCRVGAVAGAAGGAAGGPGALARCDKRRAARRRRACSARRWRLRPGWAPAVHGLVDAGGAAGRLGRGRGAAARRDRARGRAAARSRRSSIAGWPTPPSSRAAPTTRTRRCWRPIALVPGRSAHAPARSARTAIAPIAIARRRSIWARSPSIPRRRAAGARGGRGRLSRRAGRAEAAPAREGDAAGRERRCGSHPSHAAALGLLAERAHRERRRGARARSARAAGGGDRRSRPSGARASSASAT